ncbi:hypothetical protein GOODEAATRI_015483, partial [Goodea atripinnis]
DAGPAGQHDPTTSGYSSVKTGLDRKSILSKQTKAFKTGPPGKQGLQGLPGIDGPPLPIFFWSAVAVHSLEMRLVITTTLFQ